MTYDLRCEMFRFAWRNIRFVFPAFWADRGQNEMKPERAVFGWNRHREEAEGRRGDPGGREAPTIPGSPRPRRESVWKSQSEKSARKRS